MAARFQLTAQDDGTFVFDLRDNDDVLMTSKVYATKNDALLDIIAAKFAASSAELPPDFRDTLLHMV